MFFEEIEGPMPRPSNDNDRFHIGEVFPLEHEPDPELLVQIGWKSEHYDFSFCEASVMEDEHPTSSWVEFAFSRQLGGAFVLWRSGTTAMEAPRSIAYGWVEGSDIRSIPNLTMAKARIRGPGLIGHYFDSTKMYGKSCNAADPFHSI